MKRRVIVSLIAGFLASMVGAEAQPQSNTPLWMYDAGVQIRSSPAVAPDGTVYFGAGWNLYGITNTGAIVSNKWVLALPTLGNSIGSASPAVGSDGTIYIVAYYLYAITPGGSQRWGYPQPAGGSAGIDSNNRIYILGESSLYALSPGGAMVWQGAAGGDPRFCSPVIGSTGNIFIASPNVNGLYCLKSDGTLIWQRALSLPRDSPAIGADGTIYVNAAGGVYAFSADGTNLWFLHTATDALSSSPIVGKDGTIYAASTFDYSLLGYGLALHAISPGGELMWQCSTNLSAGYSSPPGTPVIDSAGTIYCTAFTWLLAFSANGAIAWAFNAGGSINDPNSYSYTSPSIGPDGTIYATFGSRLYAFSGTNAPANSPWPMYRQNPRHTGKVEKPSLQRPQKRSDANFQFELFGQISNTFNIEASTNLNDWTSVTSLVATAVPMEITDFSASNYPARFYRAVSDSTGKGTKP